MTGTAPLSSRLLGSRHISDTQNMNNPAGLAGPLSTKIKPPNSTHPGAIAAKNVDGIKVAGLSVAMPFSVADNPSSSLFLAKCGSTLFCLGRSVLLWVVVFAVFLLGALRQRLFHFTRRASEGFKQS